MKSELVSTILAILWVGGWIVGGTAVVVIAFMRCPKCRGWHSDKDEQDKCKGA